MVFSNKARVLPLIAAVMIPTFGCDRKDAGIAAEPTVEQPVAPESPPESSSSPQEYVFGEFKVMVTQEGASDFKILCFRARDGDFSRHGTELNIVGFSPPALSSNDPPTLTTTHIGTGEPYYLEITGEGFDLIPVYGEWEEIRKN